MDYYWTKLDARDKGEYRSELLELKQQLDSCTKDMDYLKRDIDRDIDDDGNDEVGKLENDVREKLLGGVSKLSDQRNQLDGVVKEGLEAQQLIRGGAKALGEQRGIIENAGRNNLKAQAELAKADRTVRMIRVREFCYRLILYIVIISLLAACILVVIVKI